MRAWAAGVLDALEAVLAPDVTLLAVEPGAVGLRRPRPGDGAAAPPPDRGLGLPGACAPGRRAHLDGDHRRSGRPRRPEPFPHGTRITVTGGLVTAMQQYRADTATV